MNRDELLKGLTAEQIEKARACKNAEELLELAKKRELNSLTSSLRQFRADAEPLVLSRRNPVQTAEAPTSLQYSMTTSPTARADLSATATRAATIGR